MIHTRATELDTRTIHAMDPLWPSYIGKANWNRGNFKVPSGMIALPPPNFLVWGIESRLGGDVRIWASHAGGNSASPFIARSQIPSGDPHFGGWLRVITTYEDDPAGLTDQVIDGVPPSIGYRPLEVRLELPCVVPPTVLMRCDMTVVGASSPAGPRGSQEGFPLRWFPWFQCPRPDAAHWE